MYRQTVITSRAGAVSKYCDEYVCVCLSVCPRGYLRNCTLYLYHFLWMLPMASTWASSGRVTKFQGTGQFRGFLPQWQCIVQHSIWDPYKTGWTDRDAVLGHQWAWPEKQRVTWGWRSTKEKGQFFWGKHVGEAGPQWPPVHSGFCIAWSQESFRLLTYFSVVNLLLLVIAFLLYFRLCNVSALSWCNGS